MGENGRKIFVEFRREDFEEIYYRNNQANIFLSPEIRTDFIIMVASGLLSFLSIFYFSEMGRAWVLPFMFTVIFLVAFVSYVIKMWPILKWKKNLSSWFNVLAKVKHFEVVITEEALTDIQDEQITITKWSNFNKALIDDLSISLTGTKSFFLPRKSVHENNYVFLKAFITAKIQGE